MTDDYAYVECPKCGHKVRTQAPIADTDNFDCDNPDCRVSITVDLSYDEPFDEEQEEES